MRSMTIFNYLLEATLFGSILILLICALRYFFRGKLGNRFIHIAWLLPVLRILIPVSLPNPLMDQLRPTLSIDADARPVADQIRTRFIDTFVEQTAATSAVNAQTSSPIYNFAVQTHQGQTGKWVLVAYFIVMLMILLWFIYSHHHTRRQIMRNRVAEFEGDTLDTYQQLLERYGVKQIPAYFVDRLPSACLVGALHPFLAIPQATHHQHLPLMIAHVICHQKNHDGIWRLVGQVCCALQWFNPLVWMAAHIGRIDGELACDDRVTSKLADLDRLAYANALVSTAAAATESSALKEKRLKERIGNVIRFQNVKRWTVVLTSIFAVAALIFTFATSESSTLPTVDEIPTASWVAALTNIPDAENAVAYARRFLESPFVDVSTDVMAFSAQKDGDQWVVKSTTPSRLLLRFSTDGHIYEFDLLSELDVVNLADYPSNRRRFSRSLTAYVQHFCDALLPHECNWSGVTTADASLGGQRLVKAELREKSSGAVHSMVIQVEPSARVLSYHAYLPTEAAGAVAE